MVVEETFLTLSRFLGKYCQKKGVELGARVHPQNVRFRNVWFQNVGLQKTSISIQYLWLVEIRRLCCSHVCRQSDGCVLFFYHNR